MVEESKEDDQMRQALLASIMGKGEDKSILAELATMM